MYIAAAGLIPIGSKGSCPFSGNSSLTQGQHVARLALEHSRRQIIDFCNHTSKRDKCCSAVAVLLQPSVSFTCVCKRLITLD